MTAALHRVAAALAAALAAFVPFVAFVAFAVLLGAASVARADAPAGVMLEELTWTELRDRLRAAPTTILVPIGGTEQSGPQLALGKHNARVLVLARRIAEGLGNTLVAPVIAYVPEGGIAPPTSHMRFPGTITVPDEVFVKTLESAGAGFKAHGFANVVFLGDHGGYQKDLQLAADHLNKAWAGSGVRALVPAAYYHASSEGFAALLRARGFRDDEIGTHAGLADTALQLAVAPQMVRSARLHNAAKPGAADGVYGGDPRAATAELGRLGADAIVAQTIEALRRETARR